MDSAPDLPIRVLYLCEYATLNGGEHSMLAVLRHLMPDQITPIVACPRGDLEMRLQELGIEHLEWNLADKSGRRLDPAQIDEDLQRLVDKARPQLVHANSLSTSRILGRNAASIDVPTVGHLRDIINISRAATDHVSACDRILAVSEATRSHHVNRGLDGTRCHVAYNGVDLETFRPGPTPELTLPVPDQARTVLTIGQIGIRKGLEVALRAVEEIVSRHADVHWLVVGERHSEKQEAVNYERDLRERGENGPAAGHVHFLGRRDDIPALLRRSDVLLHAARQEPLGRVLLEAAASGLAIVATDVGGTREIFPHDQAFLVPRDDATAMTAAIDSILSDMTQQAKFQQSARQRAVSAFSVRTAAATLMAHYRELL